MPWKKIGLITALIAIACGGGLSVWLLLRPDPVAFHPLYPDKTLSNYGITSSPAAFTEQEGTKLVQLTLQSPKFKVALTEQNDPKKEAYNQFSQKKGAQEVSTKWGSALVLYSSIATIHTSGTTIFAQSNHDLTSSDWQNIFNSLTLEK